MIYQRSQSAAQKVSRHIVFHEDQNYPNKTVVTVYIDADIINLCELSFVDLTYCKVVS